jgi:hypothetical protein
MSLAFVGRRHARPRFHGKQPRAFVSLALPVGDQPFEAESGTFLGREYKSETTRTASQST